MSQAVLDAENTTRTEISYKEYYARVLREHVSPENPGGLKLVVGPTGMGKTRAIPEVIREFREQGIERRYIYTSNRHLLIEEMEDALAETWMSLECFLSIFLLTNQPLRLFYKSIVLIAG